MRWTKRWREELRERSPTALALCYDTDEAKEGVRVFEEKRKPDFARFRR